MKSGCVSCSEMEPVPPWRRGRSFPSRPGADVDRRASGAERAEEAFVAGEGEEVDIVGLDVDGDVAGGLRRVDEESDTSLTGNSADVADWLNGPRDVGPVDDCDQFRVRAESLF